MVSPPSEPPGCGHSLVVEIAHRFAHRIIPHWLHYGLASVAVRLGSAYSWNTKEARGNQLEESLDSNRVSRQKRALPRCVERVPLVCR